MSDTKTCTKCGEEKPLDGFGKDRSAPSGLQSYCKMCKSYCRARWYEANKKMVSDYNHLYREDHRQEIAERVSRNYKADKERFSARNRAYHQANKEERCRRAREYYHNNKLEIREKKRAYDRENKEKKAERRRRCYERNRKKEIERAIQYNKDNREKIAEAKKKWRKENPEKVRAKNSRRRARKEGALHPEHDPAREAQLYRLAKRLERMTGKPWHVDHVVPLSQDGWHHHDNLQVIPAKWNLQKGRNVFWEPKDCPPWFRVPTVEDFMCGGVAATENE